MINQYKQRLEEDGFNVEEECNLSSVKVDLFAHKNEEKRIYEFDYFSDTQRDSNKIGWLRKLAESINAKLYIVHMTRPREKEISFDNLAIKLHTYLNDNMPDELNELSTSTTIAEVMVDSINIITISDSIRIAGDATISVRLQFGSDSDDGYECNDSFPMTFEAELDKEFEIQDCRTTVDVDQYYSDMPIK
jgi:glycine betaine/choline ABC-type transport system substrate-binding protein